MWVRSQRRKKKRRRRRSKATSATGEQFIKDAGAVKAAPSILISDPDDLNFSIAHVEIVASNLSSTARLGITQSGLQMQTAFNLKVDGLNTGKLTIYKGTQTDNNFIGRDVLEKILKEINLTNKWLLAKRRFWSKNRNSSIFGKKIETPI